MVGDRVVAFNGSLPDILPSSKGILLVGINPSFVSVQAGHYYRGRLGKRLWARLSAIGLLQDAIPGHEDDAFARSGNGLTDIVKRPTRSAKELSRKEMEEGAELLKEKIRKWMPDLILFSYREPAVWLLGKGVRPGLCGKVEGVRTFLLSSPYAPSAQAAQIDRELAALTKTGQRRTRVVAEGKKRPRNEADTLASFAGIGAVSRIGASRTQRITAVDIRSGRICLPRRTKRFFPRTKGHVVIILRGEWLEVRYDPRIGPDRERSAVLSIGRARLERLVKIDEILSVSVGGKGGVHID